MGFFGMLCLWHVLEYLGAFPKLIVPMESITRALPQILSFLVVYLLVVFGWSLLFLSYFGLLTEFSTFTRAFLHLLYISAGDFDIVPLFHETQYEYYGELFIFFFRMMTTIMVRQRDTFANDAGDRPYRPAYLSFFPSGRHR